MLHGSSIMLTTIPLTLLPIQSQSMRETPIPNQNQIKISQPPSPMIMIHFHQEQTREPPHIMIKVPQQLFKGVEDEE
jgi:hypothetical protein